MKRPHPAIRRALAALAAAAVVVATHHTVAAQGDATPILARSQILITGGGLVVNPSHQVVPRNTATVVDTLLSTPGVTDPGGQASALALPADAVVMAELVGPAFGSPITLAVQPGQPFRIQPLPLAGLYYLRDIRLVSSGATLLTASPDAVTLEVIDQLLVSQVTSRALSAQEIRDKGIVVDQANFQVLNFSAAFGLQNHPVTIDFPMIVPTANSATSVSTALPALSLPALQPAATPAPTVDLPRLIEAFQTPNVSISGLLLKVEDEDIDRQFQIPPIPGVIVIPGNIAYLNQFFSVMLLVSNVAPGGSNLVVRDVHAEIVLPAGSDTVPGTSDDPLRMARVGNPPTEQPKIQAVVQPGPDGLIGTSDDVLTIAPQESGRSEHLVEGLREGVHTVEMKITATLDGLPIGPVPVSGRVTGTVEVRNPTFALTLVHPATISAGEEYDLRVTVTNTSTSPANFVSLNLLPRSISGALLLSNPTESIDTIGAGDAVTVAYHLRAQTTGTVVATSFSSDGIPGRFELSTAVGALGIPMSPNTLVLPRAADALPADLKDAALGFLGQAFALATSPVTPQGRLPLTQQIVYERANDLARAGQRLSLGEPLASVARDLLLDWTGNGYSQLAQTVTDPSRLPRTQQDYVAFDDLLRASPRGEAVLDVLGSILGAQLSATGAAAFTDDWAQAAGSRAPELAAVTSGTGAGPSPVVFSLTDPLGRRTGIDDATGSALRAIPFSSTAALTSGEAPVGSLLLESTPGPGNYTLTGRAAAAGTFDLGLIAPDGGGLRRLTYSGVAVASGALLRLVVSDGGTNAFELDVDDNADGVVDRRIAPSSSDPIVDQGPHVVSARQLLTGSDDLSQTGQLVAVLFSEAIDPASAQDGVQTSAITAFAVDANQVLGAAVQPGGRVVLLSLRDGIGPLTPRSVTVTGIHDLAGNTLEPLSVTMPIQPDTTLQGGSIAGRVLRADGTPVPSAQLRFANSVNGTDVIVSVKTTDAAGRFTFDYARVLPLLLQAVDPSNGERGDVRAQVAHNGQHLDIDVILLGTGTLVGRALSLAGAPLAQAVVKVTSLTRFGEIYTAATDANGAFSIAGIAVGNVTIEAVHAATNSKIVLAGSIPGAGRVVAQDLTLIPVAQIVQRTGALAGQVFHADGVTPAAGIPVFTDRGGAATTDASGTYRLDTLPAGAITVRAIDQARFEQATVATTIVAGTTITANLRLFGGTGSIAGVVLDAVGSPVPNAVVGGGVALVRTTATGEFTLADVPLGSRTVTALDEARQLTGSAGVTLAIPGEVVHVQVTLESRGSLAGRVFEADGVTPVGALKIYLLGGRNLSAITDANGGYRFDQIPVGTYTLSAFRPDFSDGNVVETKIVFNGEVRTTNVKFRGHGRVTGTIFAADGVTPLAAHVGLSELQVRVGQLKPPDNLECLGNVSVGDITVELPKCESVGLGFTAVPVTRVADSDVTTGRFVFDNVFVGPATVQAGSALIGPTPISASGSISGPGQTLDLALRLTPTSTITGTIFLPDGTHAGADFPVTLSNRTVVTDSVGRFLFTSVPSGSFEITVRNPADGLVGHANVGVAPGTATDVPIRILGRGRVTVQVTGINGVVPGAHVRLQGAGYPFDVRNADADDQGRVVFDGGDAVTEGPFSVSATDSIGVVGFASNSMPAPNASVDVAIVLSDEVGSVVGHVYGPDGSTPIANAQVRLSSVGGDAFATSDSAGAFEFQGVRRGAVTVEIFDPVTSRRGRSQSEITANGQQVPVDVSEIAQGHVTGVVRLSTDRSPVAGASMTLSVASVFGGQFRTSTGANGTFAFPGVSAGSFNVQATDSTTGLSGSASGTITTEGEEAVVEIVLQVPALGRLSGLVMNADGSVAFGAQVTINGSLHTTVDNTGAYSFDNVPVGDVSVSAVSADGFDAGANAGHLAFSGDAVSVDVHFLGTGHVTGLVRQADGSPAPFAQVTLGGRNALARAVSAATQSGQDGRFAFDHVFVGDITLSAVQSGTGLAGSAAGRLESAASTLDLVVTLQPAGSIHGVVVHETNGAPAVGMAVELTGPATRFGSTGIDGTVSFASLPLGTYQVLVSDPLGSGIGKASATIASEGQALDMGTLTLDEAAPQVTAITPANGALGIPVGQPIQVQFSEAVAPSTVNGSTLLVASSSGPVSGVWALGTDARTATFVPAGPFGDFAQVTVKVTTGVQDRVGKPLVAAAVSSFTTSDSTPPAIVTASPAPNATGAPLSSVVRVGFSEAVDPARFTGSALQMTLNGVQVTGRIDFILNNTAVVFTPDAPLAPNASYQVAVAAPSDIFGNRLPQGLAYRFQTIDTIAPIVQRVVPDSTDVFEGSVLNAHADIGAETDVAAVEFLVNGQVIRTDTSAPFEVAVPVNLTMAPSFEIAARATDFAGNVGPAATVTISVRSDSPPAVAILAPLAGAQAPTGSSVTVRVHSTDDRGVTRVSLQATGVVSMNTSVAVSPAAAEHDDTFIIDIPASTAPGVLTIRAVSTDTHGAVSATASTAVAVTDATPPAAQILAPVANARIDAGQTFDVTVSATDTGGVASIALDLTGAVTFSAAQNISPAATTAQATFHVVVPADAAQGTAIALAATARDAAGNTSPIAGLDLAIHDATAPLATITVAGGLTTVQRGRTIGFTVTGTDNVAVSNIGFQASGAVVASGSQPIAPARSPATADFTVTVPADAPAGSTVTLVGTSTDASGNAAASTPVVLTVVVDQPPTVAITSPANGSDAVEGATIAISADAADDVRVARVEFRVDGVSVATFTAGPFTSSFVVPGGAAGTSMVIEAFATDTAGQTTRASITLTRRADVTPPQVVSMSPANQAVDVPLTSVVQAGFTEPLDPATVTSSSFRVSTDGQPIAGTLAVFDGNRTVRFTPNQPLPTGAVIVTELTGAITDAFGNALVDANGQALSVPLTFTFLTGSFGITHPVNNSDVVENSSLTLEARGSASLNISTVVFTVNGRDLTPVTGPVFTTAFLVPGAATPQLTIDASARDAAGAEVAHDRVVVQVGVGLSVSPAVVGVPLGGAAIVHLKLSSALADDLAITLQPVDPSLVTLPAGPVVLPAHQTAMDVTVGGAAIGNTTIVASSAHGVGAAIASISVPVQGQTLMPQSGPAGAVVRVPPMVGQLFVAPSTAGTIGVRVLAEPASGNLPVTVSSSTDAVVTASAVGPVHAGQQVVSLSVVTGAAGTAMLTIHVGDQVVEIPVFVGQSAPAIAAVAPPVGVSTGAAGLAGQLLLQTAAGTTVGVRLLTAPASSSLPVQVTSSNPAVATVTGPLAIPAGSEVVNLPIVTGDAGTAVVTLRVGSSAFELRIAVGTAASVPAILAPPAGVSVRPAALSGQIVAATGIQQTLGIRLLSSPAAADTAVVATSNHPEIAAVTGSPIVRAGAQVSDMTIATGSPGVARIVLRVGDQVQELTVVVGSPDAAVPAVLAAPVGVAVQPAPSAGVLVAPVNGAAAVGIRLTATPGAGDVVVQISSSDPSIASVQGPIVLHAGEQVVNLSIATGTAGVATLTAHVGNDVVQFTVVVGTPPSSSIPAVIAAPLGVQVNQ